MKKTLLLFLLFLLYSSNISIAQPANDNCASPQAIGTLPIPGGCPAGLGAIVSIPGTLVAATASSPYAYMTNCSGAGGLTMSHPANDVWYTFVATGSQLIATVTSTFANPNVALFTGNCSSLYAAVGGCAVGASGTVILTVNQMTLGTTYYILVSGSGAQTGTFNLDIRNNNNCNDCMVSSDLTVTPLPVNGTYTAGQVVNFCYHISQYTQINTNWLHGVQVLFGAGWNIGSLIAMPPPTCQTAPAGGTWGYYPLGEASTGTGLTFPAGFYFDANTDGNPGNNYGDNCNGFLSSSTWNFCFNITALADSNLRIVFSTSGDGESGSWSSISCAGDQSYVFDISRNNSLTAQVDETNLNADIFVYPNPFKLSTTFKIKSKSKIQNGELIIYDIYGRAMRKLAINSDEIIVEKGDLESGVYFFKFINGNKQTGKGKFIIE